MRGVAFSNSVPALYTVGPTYASEVNAALQEAIDLLEQKIVVAEIDIQADLDMNSNQLTEVDAVELDNQASAALSGAGNAKRINAYGGELYWCDGAGNSVKITDGGILNGASGDIGGDYGDGSESVDYSAADNSYTFTDDSTAKAIIDAKEYYHEDLVKNIHAATASNDGNGWEFYGGANGYMRADSASQAALCIGINLRVGDRIKSISAQVFTDAGGDMDVEFRSSKDGTSTSISANTGVDTSGAWADSDLTGLTTVIAADTFYYVEITAAADAHNYAVTGIEVSYDRV